MERGGGVKAFVASPLGKALLTAVAAVVLALALIYLGALIAIAAFLLFMLAIPIYLGWKRPRELAVCGLIALLVAGPIASTLYAQEIRSPSAAVASDAQAGTGGTGSVLTNAYVSPFAADTGTSFKFSVTVNPEYLPSGAHAPEYVVVYLTTCPGADSANNSACGGGGYPFWELNDSFNATINTTEVVGLSQTLHAANLWFWLMAFIYTNSTNGSQYIWVNPQSGYNAVQGPVSGSFASTVGLIIPTVYGEVFVYVGLTFYAGLLLYWYLRVRSERRNAPPPGPLTTGAPGGPPGPSGPSGASAAPSNERKCANCGAVIYPSETSCWKCGRPVAPAAAASPPLN